jgi:hypothetical protein
MLNLSKSIGRWSESLSASVECVEALNSSQSMAYIIKLAKQPLLSNSKRWFSSVLLYQTKIADSRAYRIDGVGLADSSSVVGCKNLKLIGDVMSWFRR